MASSIDDVQENIDTLFRLIFDSVRSHDGSIPQEQSLENVLEQYRRAQLSIDNLSGNGRSVESQEAEIKELLQSRSELISSIKNLENDLKVIDEQCDRELDEMLHMSSADVKELGR